MATPEDNTPTPGAKAGKFVDIDCTLDDLEGVASVLMALAAVRDGGMAIDENALFAMGKFIRLMVCDLRAAELPTAVERRIAA